MIAQRKTRSADSERFRRRVTYHDREYQDYSIRHETYLSPIDLASWHAHGMGITRTDFRPQEEETRLRDQHEMVKMIYQDWDNSMHPNFMGDLERILDCGFGSGDWACDLAEYDPDCTVSATLAGNNGERLLTW